MINNYVIDIIISLITEMLKKVITTWWYTHTYIYMYRISMNVYT